MTVELTMEFFVVLKAVNLFELAQSSRLVCLNEIGEGLSSFRLLELLIFLDHLIRFVKITELATIGHS